LIGKPTLLLDLVSYSCYTKQPTLPIYTSTSITRFTIPPTVDKMSNNKFDALGSDDSEGEGDPGQTLVEVEKGAFTPLAIPEGEHRLQSQYCLWYSRRGPGKQSHNFDQNLKLLGRFATCEQFWAIYSLSTAFGTAEGVRESRVTTLTRI